MDDSGSLVHGTFSGAGNMISAAQSLLNARWLCSRKLLGFQGHAKK
jgi:hypothetical protein